MNLINKENNITLVLYFVNKPLNSALKLTSELRTCNESSKVKKIYFFVCKASRNFSLSNSDCKSLSYSRFTYAGLTDKTRIIFCPAAKDLDSTGNFAVSADNSIHLALLCFFGKIVTIIV